MIGKFNNTDGNEGITSIDWPIPWYSCYRHELIPSDNYHPVLLGAENVLTHCPTLFVFGGSKSYGEHFAEIWILQLSHSIISRHEHQDTTLSTAPTTSDELSTEENEPFSKCETIKWEVVTPSNESKPPAREFPCVSYNKKNQCIYVFGGFGQVYLNDFWKFDLKTKAWIKIEGTGEIPSARCGCSGSFAPSRDKFFVFGGYHGQYLNDFYELDLETQIWKKLNSPHKIPSLTVLTLNTEISENYFTLFGGYDSQHYVTNMYHYDLNSQQWHSAVTDLIKTDGTSNHSRCLTLRGKFKSNIPNRNHFMILYHTTGARIFEYDEEESQLIKYKAPKELQAGLERLDAKFIGEVNENTLVILANDLVFLIEIRKLKTTKSLDYFTLNLKERTKSFSDVFFL